ncbi:MAG: hydantoinase B/oxoprolinase family protein [Rhizobiaceae bacterium]
MRTGATTFRAGVDIGGTFTDFALFDEDGATVRLHKRLTSVEDPSIGALDGLSELISAAGISISQLSEIVHGTTLVTNALIERKGVRVGMLTTRGFRDIIEIATEQRYDIYDLKLEFPKPLVERAHRCEVQERIGSTGAVLAELDELGVRMSASMLVESGCEAIAVCFLHSYSNPVHERRARDLIKADHPGLSVSISSEVVAEISEYQRFVTTCANAFVQPVMDRYLGRFEKQLYRMGFAGAFRLVQSAGGIISVDEARSYPVRLLESGPAGGALATAWFAGRIGIDDVISFDMGGTTAKACLIENGKADITSVLEAGRMHRFKKGSGIPIKTPVVDMIEIGAGGGSIAWIDEVGLLRVGPHSSGASPGPACYRNGGTEPTVTDASVALGYYDPDSFLGGRMALDASAATRALDSLGTRLGLSVAETAWGIHQVVSEAMASAAQIHLIEKGKDPRGYKMVGFGGAGPAFAARVARILGISEVIIPPASGAASAFGFLSAPLSIDLVRSRPTVLSQQSDLAEVNVLLMALETDGRSKLKEMGVPEYEMAIRRNADMRILGQVHVITVPLPDGEFDTSSFQIVRRSFDEAYAAKYARVPEHAEVEILSFRLNARGLNPYLSVDKPDAATRDRGAQASTRQAYFGNGFVETDIWDRYSLNVGDTITGPAIIQEREATTIIAPGDTCFVDDHGNLHIAISLERSNLRRITAEMPIGESVRMLQADPITLEIMWNRLVTVTEEMWHTVCRTAFSLIISESQDFGCSLLDAEGQNLAHSSRAMPVFNLTLPNVVKAVLERFPADTLEPGDVLVTNDPWLCAGHLFDLAVVTPVFRNGRIVAILGTVGHLGDIGGTRDSMRARELFEEGLQIPPMKLVKRGEENEDLFRIIAENVRDNQQVMGDIRSLIAANEIGSQRLLSLMDEYGLDDLVALTKVIQSLSEKAMRDAIRDIPDGTYTSEISYNPAGTQIDIPVTITVSGDEIELDFAGAPAEITPGGVNCTFSYTRAHATYPFKCMLTPSVRGNAGCYKPFKVVAPANSVLNCSKPAPVSLRIRTGWYLSPNIFRAFCSAAADKVVAFTGLPSMLSVYGKTSDGRVFYDHLLSGGGQGAASAKDGKSSMMWPTSAATSSIELLESRSPVIIREKGYVQDSGGPGKQRGGLATRIQLAKRENDGIPITVLISPEGASASVDGLDGGAAGFLAHGRLLDAEGATVKSFTGPSLMTLDRDDLIVELQIGGGSGFGEPTERSREAVDEDRRQGYVSDHAAERIYRLSTRSERG